MNLLIGLIFLFFAYRRLLNYLRFFQQEEYANARFLNWIIKFRAIDKKASFIIIIALLVRLINLNFNDINLAVILIALGLLIIAIYEPNPQKTGKKKLVLTARVRRILGIALTILSILIVMLIIYNEQLFWQWIILIQALPLILITANIILQPYENITQQHFWNEAHQKLINYNPIIIGITGSYGKTSVKHILGHLLANYEPTLITPGSVNTPMGIARIVREQLTKAHRYFVCEMGAYGVGSIAGLCKLAPPNYGIITALGMAHYERFKSLETVCQAKFELAQAVINNKGTVIIPENLLNLNCAQQYHSRYANNFLTINLGNASNYALTQYHLTAQGVEVVLFWNGQEYRTIVPVYGESHAINIALAFMMACQLGMNPEHVKLALTTMPQISHRFEVKKLANGVTLIDDAYNSNPEGFKRALVDMGIFVRANGRKILVTPGVVELGAKHDEIHHELGKIAATTIDILLPVASRRIDSLVAAFIKNTTNGIVSPCENFAQAQDWITTNAREGDVILLENDLPDLYEQTPQF